MRHSEDHGSSNLSHATRGRAIARFLLAAITVAFFGPAVFDPGAFAQPRGPHGPRAAAGDPAPGSDEAAELQETLEIYMIAKMKHALGLSRDQEEKVVPLIQDLSESRRQYHREKRLALMMLRPMAEDPNSSEEEIRTVLARLDQIESGFRSREARSLDQIRAVLTPRQQAQFFAFQESFRTEMMQRLRQFREMGSPGGAPGGPRGRPRRQAPPPPPTDEE